jgi:hypothetical protein
VINGKVFHHSEFVVVARADGTAQIAVLAGEVTFEGMGQALTLRTGELTDLDASGMPSGPRSFAPGDLVAWWESDELIQLPDPEPSLEDFRALELREVEVPHTSASADVEKSSAPAPVISERRRVVAALSVGGAVMLVGGGLLLLFGGALAWRMTKRRQARPSPPTRAPHSVLDKVPEQSSGFDWAEQRFATLQDNYRSGQLDLAAFRAEVQKLVVKDEHGQYWALGGEGGTWYWYDGHAWVRQEPPR